MLPDTDSLILFWSVARAQHQQHRLIQLLVSRWQGKTSQVVSGLRSVAGVLESDGAQPVPGAQGHRIGRTRMTPWSRQTAHWSRRRASASRVLQSRARYVRRV
jgi:hypothetical protein